MCHPASSLCVIVIIIATRSQAALVRAGGRGAHAMPTNLFQLVPACRIRGPFQGVSLTTLPVSSCIYAAVDEQAHIPMIRNGGLLRLPRPVSTGLPGPLRPRSVHPERLPE